MVKVILYTDNFKFVHEQLMPKFIEFPRFLIWGQRFFEHYARGTYIECFAYFLVPDINTVHKIHDVRQQEMFT